MGRKATYDKRELSVACSKLKVQLTKKVEDNELNVKQITKTFVYTELSKRLKLTSNSSFWKPSFTYKAYLDQWYDELEVHLKSLTPPPLTKFEESPPPKVSVNQSNIESLNKEIKEKNTTINTLLSIIATLRIENESLRISKLTRFDYIDTLNVLREDISDVELEQLYQTITKLYEAKTT